ncbi:AAA family ATPase [Ferroplasma acidiphilum]|uniref:AAA family ATPase n=1 Tax=Ferroplasma acidiphilum TaxID=74969 RepID=A0A7K4FN28_9ARCH|nr:AAA family ATPase [Ferroplasma acidiphilum]NOL60440.1 AAA family ATPase [Ferroplasma acidiphilum]
MTDLSDGLEPEIRKQLSVKYRLKRFRVTNFRSIVDSGYIDIKNQTTVLIGSNRAGKSSLLNALEKLNYDTKFAKFDLTQLGDISFSYMNGKINGSQIKIIEAEFEPVRRNMDNDELLTVAKFFDSSYHIQLGTKGYTINPHNFQDKILPFVENIRNIALQSSNSRLTSLMLMQLENLKNALNDNYFDYNRVFMLIDIINDMEFEGSIRDQISENVNLLRNQLSSSDVPEILKEIPRFIYFSAYDRLEDRVTLTELKENPGEHGTFMNLLSLAQIDLDRIEYMDPDQRVAYFEKASNIISKKLSTIWGFHEGRLEIRYEQGKSPLLLVMITPEESRDYLVPPGMESDGFQWFLSVFINLNSKTGGEYSNSFLMLDDLGILLHPVKQKNFLDFLREALPENICVIYTTHLPFFIPLEIPESILLLSRTGSSSTITDLMNIKSEWKDKKDVLAPIYAALGYGILENFFINKTVFLVESRSDQILLNYIWHEYNLIKNNIPAVDVSFIGQNNHDDIYSYVLWMQYNGVPFYIILNDNIFGREAGEKLKKMNIGESRVKLIPSKISIASSTIEDFIDPEIIAKAYVKYHKIYNDSQLKDIENLLRRKEGVINILEKYSMENGIEYNRSGTAGEIVNIMKSVKDDNSIINLYNIVFSFIVEEDYSYPAPEKPDNGNIQPPPGNNTKSFLSRLNPFSRKNSKNSSTLPGRKNTKNLEFSFESESKILSISVSSGVALLYGNSGNKLRLMSNIIRYAHNNGRHVVILTTSHEKEINSYLDDTAGVDILSLSPAYFRQRLINDVGQAMTLAGKLYVEVKDKISNFEGTLFIIYKIDDVIPVQKKGNSIIYQNEFWRVFFQFINSFLHKELMLLVSDSEEYCDSLSMYVNTIISLKVVNNLLDVSIDKNSI